MGRATRKDNRGGFTLMELLLVTALLGALAASAAPAFRRSYMALGRDAAAWSLSSSLAYARDRAVIERRPVRVAFGREGGSWRLESADEGGGFAPRTERAGRRRAVPAGVALAAVPDSVTFRPDGTADALEVTLSTPAGGRLRLRMDPVLGRARIDEEP